MPVNIHGKEYMMVNERLELFHSDNPNASINTKLISVSQLMDTATGERCNEYIVKAEITPDVKHPEVVFTGLAAERDNDGPINKTSSLENAETSCIGRALAFMGYGSEESIASAEEVIIAQGRQKNFQPTIKSLTDLDKSMNNCFNKDLIDKKAVARYNSKRSSGMTKKDVSDSQTFFDKLLTEESNGIDKNDEVIMVNELPSMVDKAMEENEDEFGTIAKSIREEA